MKKLRNFHIHLMALTGITMAVGCGDNGASTNTEEKKRSGEVFQASAGRTYLKMEDADTFMSDWSTKNIVVCHSIGDPDNLHPTNGNTSPRTAIHNFIHRYLIASDPKNLSVMPDLVTSLPEISHDDLHFTYTLRDDVTFDDGSPLTVDDVIFSLKAAKCPLTNNPQAKPYLQTMMDIIKEKDPRKFTIVMSRRYLHNIVLLTDFVIIQESFYDKNKILALYPFKEISDSLFRPEDHPDLVAWANGFNDSKFGMDPAYIKGLGPYEVVSWEQGQAITLVRKKDHWTQRLDNPTYYDRSYPEKIIFKLNRDANSQILDFKSQVMDASFYTSSRTILELQKDDNFNRNYHSCITTNYNYSYMALNMRPDGVKHKKLFTDEKVRNAMALLTPVEDIRMVIGKGKAVRQIGPVSPLKPDYNSDLTPIPLDVEKAKKLLDETGWKDTDGDNIRDKVIDGEKIQFMADLHYMNSQVEWKDMATMIKESCYKAGIQINLVPLELSVHYNSAMAHDFDLMLGSWSTSYMPDDFSQLWHTESWGSQGSNFTGFGSPETDALIDSIRYCVHDSLRIPMVHRFQEILYREQPYIFMTSGTNRNIVHKRFGNVDILFDRTGAWLPNLQLLYGKVPMQSGAGPVSKESSTVN
ncbi:MAG: hypothetical protein KDD36_14110 [Flavobacteriales bacterium]|nr:hypothetical protein [Flavobacteriales bacterium]